MLNLATRKIDILTSGKHDEFLPAWSPNGRELVYVSFETRKAVVWVQDVSTGKRRALADQGISDLQQFVDTLIIIPNQNLFRVANEKTTFADAFAMADQVLYSGVACITDLMVKEGLINLDFADVRAVMREMGKAMMGTGEASGEKRALSAAEAAISNPLLDDVSMRGARGLLISITGGPDLTRGRAVIDGEREFTYGEFLERCLRLGGALRGMDVPEGGRVAVLATAVGRPGRLRVSTSNTAPIFS